VVYACRTMFIKRVKARGITHVQLLESYWQDRRAKHRLLKTLGRKDQLDAAMIDRLRGSLKRYSSTGADWVEELDLDAVTVSPGRRVGCLLLLSTVWRELELGELLRPGARAAVSPANLVYDPAGGHSMRDEYTCPDCDSNLYEPLEGCTACGFVLDDDPPSLIPSSPQLHQPPVNPTTAPRPTPTRSPSMVPAQRLHDLRAPRMQLGRQRHGDRSQERNKAKRLLRKGYIRFNMERLVNGSTPSGFTEKLAELLAFHYEVEARGQQLDSHATLLKIASLLREVPPDCLVHPVPDSADEVAAVLIIQR
jgi:hypothetical protein